jgi:hypothetical protein
MTTRTKPVVSDVAKTEGEVVEMTKVVEQPKTPTALETFMDHQRKAVVELGNALKALIPVATKEHSQAAFEASVKGYRELFNKTVDEVADAIKKIKVEDEKKN